MNQTARFVMDVLTVAFTIMVAMFMFWIGYWLFSNALNHHQESRYLSAAVSAWGFALVVSVIINILLRIRN